MQHFLEAGVKGMKGHVLRFFLTTTHVVEETVTGRKMLSNRGNMIKEGVVDLLESVRLVCSVIIFNIFRFFHCLCPISAITSIMQHMILTSGAKLVNGEDTSFVVGDNVVKNVSNFEGIIKASSSIIMNRDGYYDFSRVSAHRSDKSSKESDQFVVRGCIIKVIVEITDMVFKGGINKAIVDFHA